MAAVAATREEDLQIAEANLASATARIDLLEAQISQTQASLQADETHLGYTRIYAPISGTVVAIEAREGQTLNTVLSRSATAASSMTSLSLKMSPCTRSL